MMFSGSSPCFPSGLPVPAAGFTASSVAVLVDGLVAELVDKSRLRSFSTFSRSAARIFFRRSSVASSTGVSGVPGTAPASGSFAGGVTRARMVEASSALAASRSR
jgi:hypothetical protein